MKNINDRVRTTAAATIALALGGCATPPSVVPLLDVAAAAIRDESAHLDADQQRDVAHLQAQRQVLSDAYLADLRGRDTLDIAWIASATEVYATARELLVRHELASAQERRRRQDNLAVALEAQARAIDLLQQRDALLQPLTSPQLIERIKPW